MNVIAFTGHRPKDLGNLTYNQFAAALDHLIHGRTDLRFVTGGALGVDTWAAEYAINHSILFDIVLPFEPDVMTRFWSPEDRARLDHTIAESIVCTIIHHGSYNASAYQQRNEEMVNRADTLFAVWTGKTAGGTANCIRYALAQNVPSYNLLQNGAITGSLRPITSL